MNNPQSQDNGWREFLSHCMGTTPSDRRNLLRFAVLIVLWALSHSMVSAWLGNHRDASLLLKLGVGAIPLAVAALTFVSYLVYLWQTDELARKVQLEGLALGFGAGVVFGMTYQIIEQIDPELLDDDLTVVVMLVSWSCGQLLAAWRYR